MTISPEVTSSSPTIIRSSVDFPQPDGPTRIMNSPSSTSRLTSFTAGKPSPYFFTMFCMEIAARGSGSFWSGGFGCERRASALDGARGEARHDPALEHQHDDHDGDGDDDRR